MSRVKEILRWPLSLLLRLFLAMVLLFLLCVGGIFCVYRFVLTILARLFRPKLGSIVDPQTTYFFLPANPAFNVVVKFKFVGILQLERVVERIKQKCILLQNETGDVVYPEFQQYTTSWGGYPFWKEEEEFSMAHHVERVILEQEKDVHCEVMKALETPFKPELSPWRITFLEIRENRNAYYMLFTFNHSLGDGASVFNALIGAADSRVEQICIRRRPTSCWRQIQKGFNTLLSCFNYLYDMLMKKKTKGWDNADLGESRFSSVTDPIPLADLKNAGRKLNVSVSMVLCYLVTGAIRRKLLNEKVSLPSTLEFLHPLHVRDHPKTLTNKLWVNKIQLMLAVYYQFSVTFYSFVFFLFGRIHFIQPEINFMQKYASCFSRVGVISQKTETILL